jgi:ATP-dependent helicase/nuclease subunit B
VFETRSPEYEVVFMPNLVERSFPGMVRNDPFLKDHERIAMRRFGFDLPPRLTRISEERYLFYIACTRASKRLYFSYPLADTNGKQLKRSHYLDQILNLVSVDNTDLHPDSAAADIRLAVSTKDIIKLAAKSFWRSSYDAGDMNTAGSIATAIYNSHPGAAGLGEVLLYGTRHRYTEEDPVLSPRARALVQRTDNTYTLSVTALESFAQCPFRYFCEHTLELAEPEVYEFSHLEAGTAAHEALQSLYRQIYVEHRISAERPEEIVQAGITLFRAFVHRHFAKTLNAPATAAFFKRNERLFEDFLISEAGFQIANHTTPARFELSFRPGSRSRGADPTSVTEGLALDCGENVRAILTGRIDRVDTLEQDGSTYGVVIDYKMGTVAGPISFEDGVDLQVPVYLYALDTLFDIRPAGGFYYYIKSIRKRGIYDKEFRNLISAKIKGKRTATDTYPNDGKTKEECRETIERSIDAVRTYVRSIHEGDISFGDTGGRDCDWCPYKDICRS